VFCVPQTRVEASIQFINPSWLTPKGTGALSSINENVGLKFKSVASGGQ